MRIVAIDCSTRVAGVALNEDERLLAETFLNTTRTHSERLVPLLDELLKMADCSWEEIDALAVTIGPGSFTGLRIGLATAKGIAHGLGKPLLGINTLDVLAGNLPLADTLILPLLDARKNEVYTCLYWQSEAIWDYLAISPEELIARLRQEPLLQGGQPLYVVGDGVFTYRDTLLRQFGAQIRFLPDALTLPRASQAALLAHRRLLTGDPDQLHHLTPFYIRRSEAETKWEKKHGRSVPYGNTLSTDETR